PSATTLTINSGVTVKFNQSGGDFGLSVAGSINAVGTQAEPIILTSQLDSAPGEWPGIALQGGSSQLENVEIRNGRESVLIGSLNPTATVQISNSLISHSSLTPLGIQAGNLHQVSLNNVTFANNVEGNNIVLYGALTLGGDAVLTDQPGLDAYVVLHGGVSTEWFVIPPTHTLTVNSGVTLKFNSSAASLGLHVEGILHTVGTQTEPVIFTSYTDSAPNQWAGIVVENGNAQLEHTELRYGTYNLTVNNTAVSTPVTLQNSQLYAAAMDGLLVMDGAVTAVCSRFTNNNGSGVFVLNTGQPTVQISSSALAGNGDAGLTNQNPAPVDARQNWWGDASGPSGIGPGSGNAVTGNVLFAPWLEEDTCATVSYQLYLPFVVTP
ncbi:MAG: hypothetical protein KC434_04335, partial [Anaerolineales bacterium]|nr:hypothetical protein [Anaerolineales bacterium]